MEKRRFPILLILVCITAILVSSAGLGAGRAASPVSAPARQGAWVDSIVYTEVFDWEIALAKLEAGVLDIYDLPLSGADVFEAVKNNPDLLYTTSTSIYNELTFNPYGPTFTDGRLNPFSNYKIREAMNWLVDRSQIASSIYGGRALERFLPFLTGFPDYQRCGAVCTDLEAKYAYDLARAERVISSEMAAMGSVKIGGKWHYSGQQIVILFIIRREDERMQIGDYVADQLESIGFTVNRQYKWSHEAAPIWLSSNPAEGQFHIYTGGWRAGSITRNELDNFWFFYTSEGYGVPLWGAYQPSAAFLSLAQRLEQWDFASEAERDQLTAQALALSLNDPGSGSVRIWIAQEVLITPRQKSLGVSSNLVGGVGGSELWPYVLRFNGEEGGQVRTALPDLMASPWNPVAGSNWTFDQNVIRATKDYDILRSPHDGQYLPQRAALAQVVVAQSAGTVLNESDWIDLSFANEIVVPADAWVDWDAENQVFVTAAEKFPAPVYANVKSTITYPADLFNTVKWHDGSPLDLSDFVMKMILTFDRGKPESAIYDQYAVPALDSLLAHFKGVRIVSTSPLVIETYDDWKNLYADENLVTWWPNYGYGPGAWHNLAVGRSAEITGELAFSEYKAGELGVDWMSFIEGGSLPILASHLDDFASDSVIPYPATLGAYITPAEASARWASLSAWYSAQGHFWLGTGPFYLDEISVPGQTLTLTHFADFPDPAGKWDAYAFSTPQINANYTSGAPGSYFNITLQDLPALLPAEISINGTPVGRLRVQPDGSLGFTLATAGAKAGAYAVQVSVNPVFAVNLTLDSSLPVRAKVGSLPVLLLPYEYVYLPVVRR
jgi:peptide/nickel transport system substrate-binding protein